MYPKVVFTIPWAPGLKAGVRASKFSEDSLNMIEDRKDKVISSVTVALKELLVEQP